MTFQLPTDTPCTCQPLSKKDAVTGHALSCPTHAALMVELFRPMPKDKIVENHTPVPTALPNVHWRVVDADGNTWEYICPHCNADAQGLLAVGGPGEVLAIFAPGSWSRIENMDAKGVDGVARVRE